MLSVKASWWLPVNYLSLFLSFCDRASRANDTNRLIAYAFVVVHPLPSTSVNSYDCKQTELFHNSSMLKRIIVVNQKSIATIKRSLFLIFNVWCNLTERITFSLQKQYDRTVERQLDCETVFSPLVQKWLKGQEIFHLSAQWAQWLGYVIETDCDDARGFPILNTTMNQEVCWILQVTTLWPDSWLTATTVKWNLVFDQWIEKFWFTSAVTCFWRNSTCSMSNYQNNSRIEAQSKAIGRDGIFSFQCGANKIAGRVQQIFNVLLV